VNTVVRAAFVGPVERRRREGVAAGAGAAVEQTQGDRQRSGQPRRWPAFVARMWELWYRRSIRSQLLVIVIALEVAAALVAGGVTVLKARTSTRLEIAASGKLAELLVRETVQLVRSDTPARQILENLPLQLRSLRHVRIAVLDTAGDPAAANESNGSAENERPLAPRWFQALIAPPIERHVVPVAADGVRIGSVLIVSEPSDEIAEVWENTVALGLVALALNLAVIGALYLLFGRALAPLTGFGRGLADLERMNYRVRLPTPKAREFIALATRFNTLAETLEAARAENADLSHRLITAQDDERRRTALDLHDEVGPSLFGLKANTTSIVTALAEPGGASRQKAIARAHDMAVIIERLQAINRSLLNRLRPMALGHISLADLVAQIVRDRAREHPHVAFSLSVDKLARSYGDSIDLTIYRCIQESLTNAIRHARATTVTVTLGEERSNASTTAGSRIALTVHDDGCGMAPGTSWGFGLRGMNERVRALGGTFTLAARPGHGTAVSVVVPHEDGGGRTDGPAGAS